MNNNLNLALINCGFVTEEISSNYFNTSSNKLNTYIKQKYLDASIYVLFGKTIKIYTLSNAYSNILKKKYEVYKHDKTQLEHDYLLLRLFCSLNDEEKLSWKNETYLKKKFGVDEHTPDAMYVKNSNIIGVEIITPNYKKYIKDEKLKFMNKYCDFKIILNTKDFYRRSKDD